MEKAKKKDRLSIFTLILICLFTLITVIYPNTQKITHAEDTTTYSTAIEDLQKDENFNAEAYPVKEKDYSLQVIQIAESVDNELFIYVYQPSGSILDLRATSINISTAINDSFYPKNYFLTYLNSDGVFYKYKVNDFEILSDNLRYYSITSIFRKFDESLGDEITDGNTISEKSFEVGKLYTATTIDNVVTYTCKDTDTILIESKYVGFVRYSNGFTLYKQACDSHYVAFSTEYNIDRLMEATVSFWYKNVRYRSNLTGDHKEYESDPIYDTKKLTELETGGNLAHGWFATKYEWKRIEKVSDFINNEDLTAEAKEDLKDKQWILRFYESDYQLKNYSNGVSSKEVQEVGDVTILSLKFEIDGEVYNLGVVDNKQTGDGVPDNIQESWAELKDWVKWVLGIIGTILLIVLIVACMPIITIILKAIAKVIVWICKGIWYVISAPFTIFKK